MKFSLTKEERAHFKAIAYAINYLETSQNQFIGGIITERLDFKPNPNESVSWKLNEDYSELTVDIDAAESNS